MTVTKWGRWRRGLLALSQLAIAAVIIPRTFIFGAFGSLGFAAVLFGGNPKQALGFGTGDAVAIIGLIGAGPSIVAAFVLYLLAGGTLLWEQNTAIVSFGRLSKKGARFSVVATICYWLYIAGASLMAIEYGDSWLPFDIYVGAAATLLSVAIYRTALADCRAGKADLCAS